MRIEAIGSKCRIARIHEYETCCVMHAAEVFGVHTVRAICS
jgi:hypothetical protein